MRYLLALALAWGTVAHAVPDDERLAAALHDVRKRIAFVDVTPEGRWVERGETMLSFGLLGLSLTQFGTEVTLRPVAMTTLGVLTLASAATMAAGGVAWMGAKFVQLTSPRSPAAVGDPRAFASAEGLNRFLRYSFEEQMRIARGSPELAEYIVQLADSIALATRYGLISPTCP